MYSTGKITTTANNTKVAGTNTKWKDNNSLVSPEQVILIQNGATIYINSIASIQSNTEMTLSFPVPAAVKDATYNILTTMVHSVSDAANKIVAMNNANVQFSDILNRWATETGTITITLPDGTTQQLRTAKEMDKQLDGKFDKKGGTVGGNLNVTGGYVQSEVLQMQRSDIAERLNLYPSLTASSLAFLQYNTIGGAWHGKIEIPKIASGTVSKLMLVGDFGFGGNGAGTGLWVSYTATQVAEFFKTAVTSVWRNQQETTVWTQRYAPSLYVRSSDTFFNMSVSHSSGEILICSGLTSQNESNYKVAKVYTNLNTTKDSNGNLKAASPIVKVFADHIESNEESEGVELKKLHTGIYQLKNVLGMHSDASWGGINGGITIPSGINQLPLVYVDYDVLVAGEQHPFNGELVAQDEHGDIVIYTSYRKHFDLPQNVQYARLKTYPEFTKSVDGEQVELENGEPVDIPNGHWIDVRVNMPSNSIYNQKQAAAEAHAKEEAERVAREEAERAELEKEQLV